MQKKACQRMIAAGQATRRVRRAAVEGGGERGRGHAAGAEAEDGGERKEESRNDVLGGVAAVAVGDHQRGAAGGVRHVDQLRTDIVQ